MTDNLKDCPIWNAQHFANHAFRNLHSASVLKRNGLAYEHQKSLGIHDLEETAKALGYMLVKAEAPAEDALDVFVNRINAIALGGRS